MTRIFSLVTAVLVLALFLFAPHPALASSTNSTNGVLNKIQTANDFENKVDNAANEVIGVLRKVGLLLAVIMLVWAGITFAARGGNPQALLDMKGRLIAAAVGLFLVFGAEMIVNLFTRTLGIENAVNEAIKKE